MQRYEYTNENIGQEVFFFIFAPVKLLIINGPNLNLLGTREQEIYGYLPFERYLKKLRNHYQEVAIEYFQSNIEGEIIDTIQKGAFLYDGIILNAGGYTHTSVAIADAIKAVKIPVVEVHITNTFAREPYRHTSLLGAFVKGSIIGFGLESYRLAIESIIMKLG
jgi:3-dehydroquinate dehydratase II